MHETIRESTYKFKKKEKVMKHIFVWFTFLFFILYCIARLLTFFAPNMAVKTISINAVMLICPLFFVIHSMIFICLMYFLWRRHNFEFKKSHKGMIYYFLLLAINLSFVYVGNMVYDEHWIQVQKNDYNYTIRDIHILCTSEHE